MALISINTVAVCGQVEPVPDINIQQDNEKNVSGYSSGTVIPYKKDNLKLGDLLFKILLTVF